MIKINLIPHEPPSHIRHGGKAGPQVRVGETLVCLVLIGFLIWGVVLVQQRDVLVQQKLSIDRELANIITNNTEGHQLIEKHAAMVAQRNFLAGQESLKYLPIHALDEISRSIDPLEVWLIGLSIDGQDVSIEGMSLSRKDVGQFITNLEASSIFSELIKMETQPQQSNGRVIQQFSLQFTLQS